jgi:hypothetical protein
MCNFLLTLVYHCHKKALRKKRTGYFIIIIIMNFDKPNLYSNLPNELRNSRN